MIEEITMVQLRRFLFPALALSAMLGTAPVSAYGGD